MAVATAAAKVHPSPPPPPPPPPARRSWSAWIPFGWFVIDAVVCLFIASMWLFCWGLVILEIVQLACGWGSPVAIATYKLLYVAGTNLVLVVLFSMLVDHILARASARARAAAATATAAAATDIEAAKVPVKGPALRTSESDAVIWDKLRDVLCEPVIIGSLASLAFILLVILGIVVGEDSPVFGSLIYYMGASGMNTVDCFLLCPLITVWIWRARRGVRRDLYVICI